MATHAFSHGFLSLSPPYIATYQFHVTKDKHWHRRGEITTESTMGRNGIKFNVFKSWTMDIHSSLFMCPGACERASERANERSGAREQSEKCGAGE